jgi:hypothetical protein
MCCTAIGSGEANTNPCFYHTQSTDFSRNEVITLVVIGVLSLVLIGVALYGYLIDPSWMLGAHVLTGAAIVLWVVIGILAIIKYASLQDKKSNVEERTGDSTSGAAATSPTASGTTSIDSTPTSSAPTHSTRASWQFPTIPKEEPGLAAKKGDDLINQIMGTASSFDRDSLPLLDTSNFYFYQNLSEKVRGIRALRCKGILEEGGEPYYMIKCAVHRADSVTAISDGFLFVWKDIRGDGRWRLTLKSNLLPPSSTPWFSSELVDELSSEEIEMLKVFVSKVPIQIRRTIFTSL